MTVLQVLEYSQKANTVEFYFSTVADLAIVLKQDPITGVFVTTFQNFQNIYFLCNTSKLLLLKL